MNIKIGQKIPNFIGQTFNGQQFDLSKMVGESNVVLYFYPKDDTPGCTVEGLDFSERNKEFRKLNTWVLGMSRDNADSHARFCRKYNLRIPLLSDPEGEYGQKLGILKDTGSPRQSLRSHVAEAAMANGARSAGGFKRTTVLMGRDGKIKHIWENVKANGHADEVLSRIKELEHQARKKLVLGKDLGSTRRGYAKPGTRAAKKSRRG